MAASKNICESLEVNQCHEDAEAEGVVHASGTLDGSPTAAEAVEGLQKVFGKLKRASNVFKAIVIVLDVLRDA